MLWTQCVFTRGIRLRKQTTAPTSGDREACIVITWRVWHTSGGVYPHVEQLSHTVWLLKWLWTTNPVRSRSHQCHYNASIAICRWSYYVHKTSFWWGNCPTHHNWGTDAEYEAKDDWLIWLWSFWTWVSSDLMIRQTYLYFFVCFISTWKLIVGQTPRLCNLPSKWDLCLIIKSFDNQSIWDMWLIIKSFDYFVYKTFTHK